MASKAAPALTDRVPERRRAVALARHFREAEGLSIAQIADRLGRSPATVKAYFYDPTDANKRPMRRANPGIGGSAVRATAYGASAWQAVAPCTEAPAPPAGNGRPRQEVASSGVTCPPPHQDEKSVPDRPLFLRLIGPSSTGGRLRVLMLDRVAERAAGRNSPATTATRRVWQSRRSLVGWDAQKQPSRRISTIQPAKRHARSRRATVECVAAAGRPPRHGTARATPTRIANAAIPARLRPNGHGNGFAKRCAHGERATALRRPPTTGRARTHAGAAAKRSNDYRPENGPRRPLSSICTGPGRRPSPTPSAAPERLGVNAIDRRGSRVASVEVQRVAHRRVDAAI
jgi:hypothetical protein